MLIVMEMSTGRVMETPGAHFCASPAIADGEEGLKADYLEWPCPQLGLQALEIARQHSSNQRGLMATMYLARP